MKCPTPRKRKSTACGETQAAQFSRWGLERRCIPAEPRRVAVLGVAFRSKYTRASSPGGGSSLTRLVSRTPTGRTGPRRSRRSPGFHHRLSRRSRDISVGGYSAGVSMPAQVRAPPVGLRPSFPSAVPRPEILTLKWSTPLSCLPRFLPGVGVPRRRRHLAGWWSGGTVLARQLCRTRWVRAPRVTMVGA